MTPEIEVLDEDLKAWYLADEHARYVPGVPTQIQLVRLLRKLLEQGDNSDSRSAGGNSVHPETAAA